METNLGARVRRMSIPAIMFAYRTLIENREMTDYRRALMNKGLLIEPPKEEDP
ncbi:MAG: hypothetical protein JWO56_2848 [Acidobacteria bacterium]|nr:hypothetical protein [Acidobacteriota bacterium]